MIKGNISINVNTKIKKKEKRKFSSVNDGTASDQSLGTPKVLKKALFSEDSIGSVGFPVVLHYKSTNAYTKVVAKPGSLPHAPKIFQNQSYKNEVSNNCHSFLSDIMTLKSINPDINERFSHMFYNKKQREEKKKVKKTKREKSPEEKLKKSTVNEENWEKKKTINLSNSFEGNETINEEEEEETVLNKIDVYKDIHRKALIFHMRHPSKFSFRGEIKLTVITGEVEVLGYTLCKNSAEVYSPDFCTPLTVESKQLKEVKHLEIKTKLGDFLTKEDQAAVLKNFKSEDSLILVEQITSTFGIVINKYFEKPLFPKDLEDVSSMTDTLKSLQGNFTFELQKQGKYFRKSPQWDKIPLGHCTVLCGGKGVGKSTLLKYYVNKLVSLGEKVLCLDFDPGQAEFTFPGCLSAVIVDQPLLGPNFTHVMDPIVMMNFGDVDVSQNPTKYLECVKYIIDSVRKNEELEKMKCFVNTMGFCKGLGVNLIVTILKLLNPNTVIQIKGSDHRNNYSFYLTPGALNSKDGFKTMPVDNISLSYDLRVIHTCAEYKKKQMQGGLKQRQLRDIMAISYLSKMVCPPFYNFNAVQPFLISFQKLYLGIDFLVDPNDVLQAFNGNTVSLSHFEPDTEDILYVESEGNDYFKVVVKPKVSPSLGIGFIRGIDCKKKKFYVMSHLSIEVLKDVNCLSLRRVSTPHSIFLKQETVEKPTVYTTLGTADVIQRVKRIFRVPGTLQNKEN